MNNKKLIYFIKLTNFAQYHSKMNMIAYIRIFFKNHIDIINQINRLSRLKSIQPKVPEFINQFPFGYNFYINLSFHMNLSQTVNKMINSSRHADLIKM